MAVSFWPIRFLLLVSLFNQLQCAHHLKNAMHVLEQQAYAPCQTAIDGIGA